MKVNLDIVTEKPCTVYGPSHNFTDSSIASPFVRGPPFSMLEPCISASGWCHPFFFFKELRSVFQRDVVFRPCRLLQI